MKEKKKKKKLFFFWFCPTVDKTRRLIAEVVLFSNITFYAKNNLLNVIYLCRFDYGCIPVPLSFRITLSQLSISFSTNPQDGQPSKSSDCAAPPQHPCTDQRYVLSKFMDRPGTFIIEEKSMHCSMYCISMFLTTSYLNLSW